MSFPGTTSSPGKLRIPKDGGTWIPGRPLDPLLVRLEFLEILKTGKAGNAFPPGAHLLTLDGSFWVRNEV